MDIEFLEIVKENIELREEYKMPVHDELGLRMKTYYEQIPKTKLMRRCPVAIRLDGKSFHTWTKNFQKPFDEVLIKSMQETMKYLCENIQGCVFGYTQSDEITLILIDYQKLTSQAWFDYEVQKIVSISASMATLAFRDFFKKSMAEEISVIEDEFLDNGDFNPKYKNKEINKLWLTHKRASEKRAIFDARCFNIPKEEAANLIYWRQLDAIRNSIQMVGQANFSHREIQNKSCNDIRDMLKTQKEIDWDDFPMHQKRGSCCVYRNYQNPESITEGDTIKGWIIDKEIPIFKGEDREYIDKLIFVGEV